MSIILERWHPGRENREFGLQAHELEVHRPTLHLAVGRGYFYLSGDLELRPRWWIGLKDDPRVPALRLRDVPFTAAERTTVDAKPENPLTLRYVKQFGWARAPGPYAFLTQSGKRDLITPGDWLWRPREKTTWNVMTDKEHRERFNATE